MWRCARRNTGTVPRLYAKESVKTRLSFMKENFSLVLKRVSLKRTRRWGFRPDAVNLLINLKNDFIFAKHVPLR